MPLEKLRATAAAIPHPVYWLGTQPDDAYEFTQTKDGRVDIRYLPPGANVGSARGDAGAEAEDTVTPPLSAVVAFELGCLDDDPAPVDGLNERVRSGAAGPVGAAPESGTVLNSSVILGYVNASDSVTVDVAQRSEGALGTFALHAAITEIATDDPRVAKET